MPSHRDRVAATMAKAARDLADLMEHPRWDDATWWEAHGAAFHALVEDVRELAPPPEHLEAAHRGIEREREARAKAKGPSRDRL